MSKTQPTEIDALLPTPVTGRKLYHQKNDNGHARRKQFLIGGAAILGLVLVAISVTPSGGILRSRSFDAKLQLSALQELTESSLADVPLLARTNDIPRRHSHPEGKFHVVNDKKHKHDGEIYHCTTQVMIMRHCDKEVKEKIHGKMFTTDMRDKNNNGHCNAKGKQRSEYIATLFVDPNHYEKLVNDKEMKDGIPPVPMIKASQHDWRMGSPASKKPQFPTPHKLYALSSARPKNKKLKANKKHENFREIETITPLSDKFHLDVDDRFGVYEEGALAEDFFATLSKSVTNNVNRKMGLPRGLDSASPEGPDICHNGMSVVNWKHSRIPSLARALGCGKNEGCPGRYKGHDFDTMWLLTFQYSLLLERIDEMDVKASMLSLEMLSKSAEGKSLRHDKKNKHAHGDGRWRITAELVNEGFDPLD